MPIEDVFSISGRGTVVTGRVERGVINARRRDRNYQVYRETSKTTVATGVEMFRKLLDSRRSGRQRRSAYYEEQKEKELSVAKY